MCVLPALLQDPTAIASGATDANAVALGPPAGAQAPAFTAAAAFQGVRAGMIFKLGPQGLGYYSDGGLQSSAAPAVVASTGTLCLQDAECSICSLRKLHSSMQLMLEQ